MLFYSNLLYFQRIRFWNILSCLFSLIFLICSIFILYQVWNIYSIYHLSLNEGINNKGFIEFQKNLNNDHISDIQYFKITPDHYLVSYNLKHESLEKLTEEINKDIEELKNSKQKLKLKEYEKHDFYILQKHTSFSKTTAYQIKEFDQYHKDNLYPIFITLIFSFIFCTLSEFFRTRTIINKFN